MPTHGTIAHCSKSASRFTSDYKWESKFEFDLPCITISFRSFHMHISTQMIYIFVQECNCQYMKLCKLYHIELLILIPFQHYKYPRWTQASLPTGRSEWWRVWSRTWSNRILIGQVMDQEEMARTVPTEHISKEISTWFQTYGARYWCFLYLPAGWERCARVGSACENNLNEDAVNYTLVDWTQIL